MNIPTLEEQALCLTYLVNTKLKYYFRAFYSISASTLSTTPSLGPLEYDNLGFQHDIDSGIGIDGSGGGGGEGGGGGGGGGGRVAERIARRDRDDDEKSRDSSNSLDENCVELQQHRGGKAETYDEQVKI